MKKIFDGKMFKPITLLLIMTMFTLLITPATSYAQSDTVNAAAKKEVKEALQLLEYIEMDKITETYSFNKTKAIEDGFSEKTTTLLFHNFEKLSTDKQAMLYGANKGDNSLQVAALAAFLAGLVAGWVVSKVLDYGAKKFCDQKDLRNYNWATKIGCDIFG